jgi:hypothetical protein
MKSFLLSVILVCTFLPLKATVWQVGASRQYTKPSQVSSLVKNNDTVAIDAGVYTADVAHWTASNLLLQGVGGRAHLKSNGQSWGGKAIWVIGGDNTRVAFIEFSECKVPDGNGAGIRLEAANLTVHSCYFHDNENGILAGDNPASDVLIEYCEFAHNGKGDGYTHNLYINHIRSLTFQYNYSHHAKVGQELKSRAYSNYILYNRLSNESDGTASREIDLPNGGLAIIMGNDIQQGTNGENSNIIGYGQEGLSNPAPHEIYVVNNTIVNERSAGSFLAVKDGTELCYAHNTIFAGVGAIILGSATLIDTAHNWNGTITAANFVDSKTYDYHLLQTSPAINQGETITKTVGNFLLVPKNEYRHPANITFRIVVGVIDIGAHENTSPLEVEDCKVLQQPFVFPNPTAGNCTVRIGEALKDNPTIELFDIRGTKLQGSAILIDAEGNLRIDGAQFPTSGVYLLRISTSAAQYEQQIIVNK